MTDTITITKTICACGCGKGFDGHKLSHGWKRRGDRAYSPECWRKLYVQRAITMRVASPLDMKWEEVRNIMRAMWGEATCASNWLMTELYAHDVRRDGTMEKLPKKEEFTMTLPEQGEVSLYLATRHKFPSLPPQTIASLVRQCQAKYWAIRRDLIWRSAVSLPNFRFPAPVPIHNQSWEATMEGRYPVVRVRLLTGWTRFRLKGGPHYKLQLRAFRQMIGGEAIRGELALLRRCNPETGRPELQVKMVAWLPREVPAVGAEGTLSVYTRRSYLLEAINSKDERLWKYNADHLRRWIAEHAHQLQRWSEDEKFEQRRGHGQNILHKEVATFQARRSAAVRKFADRMDSAIHEIAFQLASYARRRKFATVKYDDSEKGFLGQKAPWFRLKMMLEEKLDAFGIQFEPTTPEVEEDLGSIVGADAEGR